MAGAEDRDRIVRRAGSRFADNVLGTLMDNESRRFVYLYSSVLLQNAEVILSSSRDVYLQERNDHDLMRTTYCKNAISIDLAFYQTIGLRHPERVHE